MANVLIIRLWSASEEAGAFFLNRHIRVLGDGTVTYIQPQHILICYPGGAGGTELVANVKSACEYFLGSDSICCAAASNSDARSVQGDTILVQWSFCNEDPFVSI